MKTISKSKIFIVFLIFSWIFSGWPGIKQAQAAMPTYVDAGAFKTGTASVTNIGLPLGIVTNDILLMFIETENQNVSVTDAAGGVWTEVTNSPQGTGTGGDTTASRITVFWSRYNGTQTNPSISDSGDHQVVQILAFRGIVTTGDPWNVTSGNFEDTSDDSLSATGATTSVANCLVVITAALMDDDQDFGATWTNADLSNITLRVNTLTKSGSDGRFAVVTGEKASAGSYTATTNTLTANSTKGMMTIALKPAPTMLSISVSPSTWGVGTVDVGTIQMSTSGNKINVTNNGNVAETFTLQIYDEDDRDEWTHSSLKNGAGNNIYVLSGIFCATADSPLQASFNETDSEDVLTTTQQIATSTKFAYAGGSANAVAVPASEQRSLWVRLDMPTVVSGTYAYEQHTVTIRISCQQP